MLNTIDLFFETLSGWLWGWPMIIALFGCHIFLTIRLKFPQRKLLTGIKLSISKDSDADGDVSQFGALVTSLAATIGIGNIVGVATAVALGGPGAVMWCWMSGILGIATKYAEALLAVKYRVKRADGKMIGGPMYAIERGMGAKYKWLAVLFAIFTILAAFGIGSSVQSNAFATVMSETIGLSKYISGALISIAIAWVTLFGVKGIANVCGKLVPFMTILYLGGCIYILFANAPFLGESLELIVSSAFTPRAAGGGFVGAAVMTAARYGIARGLFSNESGMGSAPIVAAAAKSRNPVRQALISSTGTFWDTVVICAITGLVLVSSVVAHPDIDTLGGGLLTEIAFAKIPYVGNIILMLCLATFSFSTILGWSYYAEKAVQYLGGDKIIKWFRVLWIVVIYAGAVMNLRVVWNIADVMNVFMTIPNIIALVALSGVAAKETKHFLWEDRLDEYSDDSIEA
ncbi:MAG: sodium:alanine symporter family protein [Rikenellaceae bacterium]